MSNQTASLSMPDQRIHSFDAARAIALSLGIVLHAALAYIPGANPWPTVDESRSVIPAYTFYVIHTFRMLAFFVLAGFFASLLIERIGARAFAVDRLKRVAVPLATFWSIVLTAIIGALVLMVTLKFGGIPKDAPPGPTFRPDDFPLTHLWFLWVLLLLYVPFVAIRQLCVRSLSVRQLLIAAARPAEILVRWYGLVFLAAFLAFALVGHPKWSHWQGIPTPDKSLYGNLPSWIAYGSAFLIGVLLQLRRHLLLVLEEQRWTFLVVGIPAVAISLGFSEVANALSISDPFTRKLFAAGLYSIAAWSLCFAFLAHCMHWLKSLSPTLRYLSQASYWVYIVHLPLVMALQAIGWSLNWGWAIEWLLVIAITFAISLGSYHLLVRNTWLGVMLNGKRHRDRAADE